MYRNVFILAMCQTMLMIGVGIIISTSVIIVKQMDISQKWATLPITIQYLSTMMVMIPVSRYMQRNGKKAVFRVGAISGAVGMALCASGVYLGSFFIFIAAGIFLGLYNAVGQFYRFAAADIADKEFKSRAISLTLLGGVIAAFVGPKIAEMTHELVGPDFTGSFIVLCVISIMTILLIGKLKLPPPIKNNNTDCIAKSITHVVRSNTFILAVSSSAIGYSVMIILMISTPLSMHNHDMPFSDIAFVIQWHLVAMFAPSFITGDLIRKFGVITIIFFGAILEAGAALVNLSGVSETHFLISLILLGIGWNFMFIGGTTLLTESYQPENKERVQGIHDLIVFTFITVSSLLSGILLYLLGWGVVNAISLIFPAIVLLMLARYVFLSRISKKHPDYP